MVILFIYLLYSITCFVLTICCIVASWVRANKILVEIGEQEYNPGIVCEAIVTLFVIFESVITVYNIYIIWSVTHKWVDDYVPIIKQFTEDILSRTVKSVFASGDLAKMDYFLRLAD